MIGARQPGLSGGRLSGVGKPRKDGSTRSRRDYLGRVTPGTPGPRHAAQMAKVEALVERGRLQDECIGAVMRAKRAEQLAEQRVHTAVLRARDAGASWPQIAEALGVTRQAARKRYGTG